MATAYLYVDGHVKAYAGKRKLAEVWNSQRRMPLPGVMTYFVGDQAGKPLLFVTEGIPPRFQSRCHASSRRSAP